MINIIIIIVAIVVVATLFAIFFSIKELVSKYENIKKEKEKENANETLEDLHKAMEQIKIKLNNENPSHNTETINKMCENYLEFSRKMFTLSPATYEIGKSALGYSEENSDTHDINNTLGLIPLYVKEVQNILEEVNEKNMQQENSYQIPIDTIKRFVNILDSNTTREIEENIRLLSNQNANEAIKNIEEIYLKNIFALSELTDQYSLKNLE